MHLLKFCGMALVFISSFINNTSLAFDNKVNNGIDLKNEKISFAAREIESLYILGPGDLLALRLYDVEELSRDLKILNDGTASIPLIGNINISGLTLYQAEFKIKELLSKELLRPELELRLVKARPIRIIINGEVARPGIYNLTIPNGTDQINDNATTDIPTIVDAIQKAGGFTQKANLRSVFLRRRLSGEDWQYKETKLDILSLIYEGNQLFNPYLFDGDIITVKKADINAKESFNALNNNLSPKEITIFVVGEVEKPGRIKVPFNTPLTKGILSAGGPKIGRTNSIVELVRINKNGSAINKSFRVNFNKNLSSKGNPPLQNGDIIKVNPNKFAKGSDILGIAATPLSTIFNSVLIFDLLSD